MRLLTLLRKGILYAAKTEGKTAVLSLTSRQPRHRAVSTWHAAASSELLPTRQQGFRLLRRSDFAA